jgi:hypothetical protein
VSAFFRLAIVLTRFLNETRTLLAQKKRRGPAPTGINPMVGVRMPPDELARLDAFIADQPEPINRPTAIRKILNDYLKRGGTKR